MPRWDFAWSLVSPSLSPAEGLNMKGVNVKAGLGIWFRDWPMCCGSVISVEREGVFL